MAADGSVKENFYLPSKGNPSQLAMRHPEYDMKKGTGPDVGVIYVPNNNVSSTADFFQSEDALPAIGEHTLVAGYGYSYDEIWVEGKREHMRIGINKIDSQKDSLFTISRWHYFNNSQPGINVSGQKGDSGGPLIYKNKIIGITSTKSGWIKNNVQFLDLSDPSVQSFIKKAIENDPFYYLY